MHSPTTRFIVGESRYLGSSGSSPLEVCRDLDVAVQLDLQYHFSGPLCAAYWIDLCQCREYGHDRAVGAISGAVPTLLDALQDGCSRRTRVGVVSLGPGDGEFDVRLLDWLRSTIEVTAYRCVDFSFELLEYAVRRIRASGSANGLPVTAVCTDFNGIGRVDTPDGDLDLWLLTGYTIGNQNEEQLITKIARQMRPGDCLMLDAHLHALAEKHGDYSSEERRALVRGYDNPTSNRFAFGPVETVTTALARDMRFDYRIGRFVTTVPGAINVVTRCLGLDARMRLTGRVVSRESLDLGSTTLYDFRMLRGWLAASPLRLLNATRCDNIGVFLLEKPRQFVDKSEQSRTSEASRNS